jgi:NAD(P)H-dependent FMN reductase
VSRPAPGEQNIAAFRGKAAGLISASPGQLGGSRALVHLRSILGNIDVLVIPTQSSVPQAMNAFNDDGSLKDAKQQTNVKLVGQKLAELLKKL